MVLEATVTCLDNSEWMRNGDYVPSRLEAQQDAINLIAGAKSQSNPENSVAVISCAGKSPEVLVTLTSDLGKILSSLHEVKIGQKLNFVSGIQVAQLVLKHRQNKNQQQRIIFFVGSPIENDVDEVVRLAKRLKKNNVAVDIINFGEEAQNTEKLEAFIAAVNNNNNSHLVTIPPGPHILSDILISSPIINEDTGGVGGAPPANRADFINGVDPNLDPELALALKISMEEERSRQEAEAKKKAESEGKPAETTTTTPAPSTSTAPATKDVAMADTDEDEAALAQAIAMSMTGGATTPAPTKTSTTAPPAPKKDTDMMDVSDEDAEMALALQMSMQASQAQASKSGNTDEVDINQVIDDPNFVNSVLMSLPGVDPNDERIKNVLASIGKPEDKDKDKEKK